VRNFLPILAILASCTGTSTTPGEAPAATPAGWVAEVASDPAAFAGLMDEAGREGWILLHANELDGAVAVFSDNARGGRSRARAALSLAVLHGDLARMSWEAHDRLFREWDRRGSLPQGSAAPAIAALSARCSGQPWKPWAERIASGTGSALVGTFDREDGLWPSAAPAADDPLAARRAVHVKAREGSVTDLLEAAQKPLVVEPAEGFERQFWDPCVHATLSDAWTRRMARELGAEGRDWRESMAALAAPDAGLEATLFAPWLTKQDLASELASAREPGVIGATMPSLAALGVSASPSQADDIDAARDEARALTAAVDAWRDALRGSASDDGKALLLDLELVERFRQEWLVARARLALLEGRPRQALAYVQLARDVADPGVGPANSPSVLALLAEAELKNGHTREALDALTLLQEAHPEVLGLREVVGDLAVLEGLDRRGDSKEN
jgi:hypothetical protein